MDEILRIEDLTVTYRDRERTLRAADGVSLAVRAGSTLALVGESGAGKTTVGLATLNLLPGAARVEAGRVLFRGHNVLTLPGGEMRRLRGREISMIFQDAASGLNPVLSVGTQVEEIVRAHTKASKREARRLAVEALAAQRIAEPERTMTSYPSQLSGGMAQRVMIAIATVLRPRLIIADEPTSALDVTVQAAILRELDELKRTLDASILLITHDLGVVAQLADDVAVMYAGRIVETGTAARLFRTPAHPYTAALLAARPRLDGPRRPLQAIKGSPPDLAALTGECAFLPRCNKALSRCRVEQWPPLERRADDEAVACYNPMLAAS